MSETIIAEVSGKGIPVRGNDIDTDRIIPARFLKCVTFETLGPESFKDDRFDVDGNSKGHSFDNDDFQGASILFSNKNFGCGSSREHAPQALQRWGIDAIVAESFAEIFFGNCISLGIPCIVLSHEDVNKAMDLVEATPAIETKVDVKAKTVTVGDSTFSGIIPDGPKKQFLNGSWDATTQLIQSEAEIKEVASSLPYTSWK